MPVDPRDPDFERTVAESFARQGFMKTLGAKLARVAAGEVEIEIALRDELTQQNGFLHAGVISTIADTACGYAARTLMPAGSDVLSVEFKMNFLAPARADRIVARAQVVKSGKTVSVCRADVFAGDTLVATMLATMMRVGTTPAS
jgi:uncharacterized protein (TIGR00369 family)